MVNSDWFFITRLVVAGLLGGLIGFERAFRAKEAGSRTHSIVALGSALFMIISKYAFEGDFDSSRVAAQVASGIGFIGAGVIIFQKNVIRGVTTAAGLWVAAAIGLACGAKMYPVAIAATILTIVVLETMHFITNNYGEKDVTLRLSSLTNEEYGKVLLLLKENGVEPHTFSISGSTATFGIKIKPKQLQELAVAILGISPSIRLDLE